MRIPFDLSGSWKILYHNEIDPAGIPVKINKEKDEWCLFIPYGLEGLTIKLDNYNDKERSINGSYTLHDVGVSNSITFKIQENASRWIGIPEGFHGTVTWKLWKE